MECAFSTGGLQHGRSCLGHRDSLLCAFGGDGVAAARCEKQQDFLGRNPRFHDPYHGGSGLAEHASLGCGGRQIGPVQAVNSICIRQHGEACDLRRDNTHDGYFDFDGRYRHDGIERRRGADSYDKRSETALPSLSDLRPCTGGEPRSNAGSVGGQLASIAWGQSCRYYQSHKSGGLHRIDHLFPFAALKPIRKNNVSRGFTLIEILAAVSVLALLGVLISQLISTTLYTSRISNQSVDAASQARLVFDRIGLDLGESIRRTDADFRVNNTGAGTILDFLSGVATSDPSPLPAGFKNRGCSRIHYAFARRNDSKGRLCLVRGARAIGWNDSGFMGIKPDGYFSSFDDTAYPVSVSSADEDILSSCVLAVVVGFQLYPDNLSVSLADGSSINQAQGQIVYSAPVRGSSDPENKQMDLSRISSLVVGLAVTDDNSLKLLTVTTADALHNAFTQSIPTGELPLKKWMADTSNLANLPSTVPLPVRQSVRLYQRFYPLTPYGTRVEGAQ
jgi:prepilin-type N-terminal cleavage/methylation domain-containing protein